MSIWRFADDFESVPLAARVTLGEGNTPLVRSRSIGPGMGMPNLYFKLETTNPTGSYKDRFAAVAISGMLARGQTHCLATSSGNTGAALAAYCAAASIGCTIALVETAPDAKLQQMLAYGARLVRVRGFGIDAEATRRTFERLEQLAQAGNAALQISAFHFSPLGMSGVQSIAYELAEQAMTLPTTAAGTKLDHVFAPAGGGGLLLAIARGFERLATTGRLEQCPRVEVVQPAGNDTISTPLYDGSLRARAVQCTSKISGLQVPTVIDGDRALAACRACGGSGHTVSDESIWQAQARVAREEGIFSEPAGATALAGAIQAVAQGRIAKTAAVACLVTGSGFKDAASLERLNHGRSAAMITVDELAF